MKTNKGWDTEESLLIDTRARRLMADFPEKFKTYRSAMVSAFYEINGGNKDDFQKRFEIVKDLIFLKQPEGK